MMGQGGVEEGEGGREKERNFSEMMDTKTHQAGGRKRKVIL